MRCILTLATSLGQIVFMPSERQAETICGLRRAIVNFPETGITCRTDRYFKLLIPHAMNNCQYNS